LRFGLKESTIEAICFVLAEYPAVEKAFIYGSRAMGSFKRGSDIDLVLVGPDLTRDEIQRIEIELDDLMLPYMFDIADYRWISNADLVDHIERVGKTFYTRTRAKAASFDRSDQKLA